MKLNKSAGDINMHPPVCTREFRMF